jgi:hypothetical protein
MAHSKQSKVYVLPPAMTSKLLSYSLPHVLQGTIVPMVTPANHRMVCMVYKVAAPYSGGASSVPPRERSPASHPEVERIN